MALEQNAIQVLFALLIVLVLHDIIMGLAQTAFALIQQKIATIMTAGMTQETTDAMLTTGTGKKSRYTGIMAAHPGAAHIQQAQRNG
jgi:hypothetical protein